MMLSNREPYPIIDYLGRPIKLSTSASDPKPHGQECELIRLLQQPLMNGY